MSSAASTNSRNSGEGIGCTSAVASSTCARDASHRPSNASATSTTMTRIGTSAREAVIERAFRPEDAPRLAVEAAAHARGARIRTANRHSGRLRRR